MSAGNIRLTDQLPSPNQVAKSQPGRQVASRHRWNDTEVPHAETLDRLQTARKWNASETPPDR